MTYQLEAFLHRVEAKLRERGKKMEKSEYLERPNAMVKHSVGGVQFGSGSRGPYISHRAS